MRGDNQLNNLVKTQLAKYSKNDSDKVYNVVVDTKHEKIIISKDKTGRATNLQLTTNINFKVNFNQKNYNFSFNESLNIENSSDSYEQRKYENIIKNNFIQSIVKKLIVRLGNPKLIFKSFELNKINLTNVKFLLFYGLNEGAKEEAISSIIKKTNIKEIIRLEEKQILENNDLFFNEVLSKSLFNNEKLIIANRATDKIFKVFENILSKEVGDINVIINSSTLEKNLN